jgi:hypothetical protein
VSSGIRRSKVWRRCDGPGYFNIPGIILTLFNE